MLLKNAEHIERALNVLGTILDVQGTPFSVVIIGGSVMNLLGYVIRPTRDVDILAFGDRGSPLGVVPPPEPLPERFTEAVRLVADEMGLMPNWLNTGPALQWKQGLPPGLETRIQWRRYGALTVGLVDRYDLIFFKLYAAADQTGPTSVHYQDLRALHPTRAELEQAAAWVRTQDPSPGFVEVLDRVIRYASTDLNLEP